MGEVEEVGGVGEAEAEGHPQGGGWGNEGRSRGAIRELLRCGGTGYLSVEIVSS